MSRMKRKAGILLCVFVAAVAVYFVLSQNILRGGEEEKVYAAMEDATLPVAVFQTMGREMNLLHGSVQEMDGGAAGSLTILPEDRRLSVRIAGYEGGFTGIRYEIRSLDGEQLVERTELKDWESGEDGVRAALPIQNLINRDEQYFLSLMVGLEDGREVRYGTRILWTGDTKAQDMVDLAADFSAKTFDDEQARELVTYLESSPETDNSSLGHVTLQSEFDQITWGGMDVQPAGEKHITLRELDGVMGNVELKYLVEETGASGNCYEVTENFTMKWDAQRIYMMSYDRTMDQVFAGTRELVSGKRILLGIAEDAEMPAVRSENGRYTVFAVGRDLWQYDRGEDGRGEALTEIFSFRGQDRTDVRENFDNHEVRILRADDGGDVDFLVCGYMNRGRHEGSTGIAFYRYRQGEKALEVRFFIPVSLSWERMSADLDRLAKLGENGMFYFYLDGSVCAVDVNSNEYLVAARDLREGSWTVSQDQSRLAWQDGGEAYGAEVIHVLNLETGSSRDITAPDGQLVQVLGFVEEDFIYGTAAKEDLWMEGSRVIGLPAYRLQIVDSGLQVQADYEKEGIRIFHVEVADGRIHLDQMVRSGDGYEKAGEDIIVCNTEVRADGQELVGWYASDDRKRVYFIQLETEAEAGLQRIAPESVTYDLSDTLEIDWGDGQERASYSAYGNGRLLGVRESLAEAIALSYDAMGYVTDGGGRIVWDRVDRPNTRNIRDWAPAAGRLIRCLEDFSEDGVYPDGTLVMDARGATLHQMLYYVGKDCPVAAYEPDGSYLLITGYDQTHVSFTDPSTGETSRMGLEEGTAYWEARQNDFVCGLYK